MRPFFVCFAFLAAAFAANAQSVLTRGNHQDPTSLDPHRILSVYENNIVMDLFEGLTVPDASGVPVPGVAQSWVVSDDGLTWTFAIRDDLRWSDGVSLTVEDVVYSFRRLMDPATASQYPGLFYGISNGAAVNRGEAALDTLGVVALGEDAVVITLKSPVPYLLELLSNGFAAIVPAHSIKEHGDRWAAPQNMVSNGAFLLEDFRPQDRVVLVANEEFHDADSVTLDRVIYLPTEDQSAALARFRSGGLDTNLEFPTARTPWLRENLAEETRIAEYLITFYLSFNTTHPVLADVRVRRALSLAIDRDTIANRVLRSGERPARSLVPPAIAGYTPPARHDLDTPMPERIAEARLLLKEAGYGPNNPLKLTYSLSSAEDRRRVAAAIAAMWKRLGVEVIINNTEGKVLFSRLRTGDFEIGYSAWAADVNDAGNFLAILHSRSSNSNYARYRNAEYDQLLDRAAYTPDPEARASVLAEAEALMLSDAPIAPLFHGVSKNLVGSHVAGWVDNPRDVHLSRYLRVNRAMALGN
ncbi:MAG: peptide ABC transporter substrate-binding protein [Rhodospirillaceae bacterium]|jgi:oligopeptide transport system substrate-binding protein|nr:peptide ABC transporter substrate-binding protein [Rhodospirillaceae bacterium]MBT5565157.1 peptide ABC transporter substrate-binding protein [Rhodospirillaceae bacterium]MBT6088179.1 peptide ABC transporter substrate-binding protein [Rhodospirillaceae bacterium]MBT7449951.1 peptide ABC transporter substrate-binding protein [Rhodospirillaceae bacterium]